MFKGVVESTTNDPNTHQIVIELGIYKEGEEKRVEIRKLGFEELKSAEEIKAELDKYVEAYNRDAEQALLQAPVDERNEQIDNTIEEVDGYVTDSQKQEENA